MLSDVIQSHNMHNLCGIFNPSSLYIVSMEYALRYFESRMRMRPVMTTHTYALSIEADYQRMERGVLHGYTFELVLHHTRD